MHEQPPAALPPSHVTADGGAVPVDWMNPNKIPPWMYFVILMFGGTTATGLNLFGEKDSAKTSDIVRLETKVSGLDGKIKNFDSKQDEILDKFTELRILIARYHAEH